MGNRGRLGLLFDAGTDSEIDALSRDWLLPPAATDKFEEVEEDLQAQIIVQHIEWVVQGLKEAPNSTFNTHTRARMNQGLARRQ